MTPEERRGAADRVDRRAFLVSAPRHIADGMKVLMTDLRRLASFAPTSQERPTARRIALLDVSRCLAWGALQGDCRLCYLRCPKRDEAIMLEGGRPTIVTSICDGCGVCVEACRAVNDLEAIQLVGTTTSRVTA